MAQNFVQDGNCVTMIAPSGGVVSGTPYLIGNTFGVALISAAEGEEFEMGLVGVWDSLPKESADTAVVGDRAYWSVANSNITTVATSNKLIGAFMVDAANGDTTATIRLNGVSVA